MDHYGYDMDYNRSQMAVLDIDDKEYAGPETITVNTIKPGQYKIFVQDYTNGGAGNSLAASKPQVKVYMGNIVLKIFSRKLMKITVDKCKAKSYNHICKDDEEKK